ncbi:glycosyltransferase family 4 protein [Prosthecodimorpha staleyi]|uniref:Glycosyltransferase n=1 Tax=Prosthecodimorpha staleyi TaxID=2840188 RepID=A0A947D9C5_9HYPH|nr:glycosyltransferase [Prosthecodimorpha staleyi]MBT9293155.1 glycosyltransferase [Prosthecodimorpha staleyi]
MRMLFNKLRKSLKGARRNVLADHPAPNFDADAYLARYPDVAEADVDPWKHYVEFGILEGRIFTARVAAPGAVRPEDTEEIVKSKSHVSKTDQEMYTKILRSGYFDPDWYLENYPDVRLCGFGPLEHWCDYGVWEGRDPGPHFSTSWYWEQYPAIRNENPLLHYIEHGAAAYLVPAPPKGYLRTVNDLWSSVRHLDGELSLDRRLGFFKGVELVDGRPKNNRVLDALKTVVEKYPYAYDRMIFVPWLVRGGAELVASHFARAAAETFGPESVAVVMTDWDRPDARDWIANGVDVISLPGLFPKANLDERAQLIENILRIYRPKAVLNVNSPSFWEALKGRGRFLSVYTAVYACLFCRDYDDAGNPAGYADSHFRDSIAHLTHLYSDNERFLAELVRQYHLPTDLRAKMSAVRQPIHLASNSVHYLTSRKILWAGRLARQKNYAILPAITRAIPADATIEVWGDGPSEAVAALEKLAASNRKIVYRGAFSSFADLPLSEYAAFLYTALWDGIPNILLEAGSHDLPIIAPDIGGISELVDDTTGYLVKSGAPHDFALMVTAVLADPEAARTRAQAMARRLVRNHSWDGYVEAISGSGHFLEA